MKLICRTFCLWFLGVAAWAEAATITRFEILDDQISVVIEGDSPFLARVEGPSIVVNFGNTELLAEADMAGSIVRFAADGSLELVAEVGQEPKIGKLSIRNNRYIVPYQVAAPAENNAPSDAAIAERLPIIAIDAGHGGVDPGAVRGADTEKELMQIFTEELEEALLTTGRYQPFLTRVGDNFVSLQGRRALARSAGADVFLSFHADAIVEGNADGITVYTLRSLSSDVLAENVFDHHDMGDVLPGAADITRFSEAEQALVDYAFRLTQPRSFDMAETLVNSFSSAMGSSRARPLLEADFVVLKNPDMPSALVELGFLSNTRDLANLKRPDWRARAISGIILALDEWVENDSRVSGVED